MGLFSSIRKNLSRVIRDVAPLGAVVAQVALPGIGGAFLGGAIGSLAAPSAAPRVNAPAAQLRGGSVIQPRCPRPGILGRAFSAPFQAANFSTGGAVPGRIASTFQPRGFVGRAVNPPLPRALPAVSACPCPPSARFARF